jgi:DNA-binding beta-propeller fold protein YncE
VRGSDGSTRGGGGAASKGLRRWGCRVGLCLAAVLGLLVTACGFTEPPIDPITHETLAPISIPPVKGQTAVIDIMAVDQVTHRLWVADGTNPAQPGIDVFDLSSVPGRYVETIRLAAVPFGLVIAPDLHRLYSGNDDGSVAVIDIDPASPRVNKVVQRILTRAKGVADLIEYDPKDHLVFVTNPDDGMISVIDPHANRVVGTIDNLNRIDQPRYDPVDGML